MGISQGNPLHNYLKQKKMSLFCTKFENWRAEQGGDFNYDMFDIIV
jgi:hypothetical protein